MVQTCLGEALTTLNQLKEIGDFFTGFDIDHLHCKSMSTAGQTVQCTYGTIPFPPGIRIPGRFSKCKYFIMY